MSFQSSSGPGITRYRASKSLISKGVSSGQQAPAEVEDPGFTPSAKDYDPIFHSLGSAQSFSISGKAFKCLAIWEMLLSGLTICSIRSGKSHDHF